MSTIWARIKYGVDGCAWGGARWTPAWSPVWFLRWTPGWSPSLFFLHFQDETGHFASNNCIIWSPQILRSYLYLWRPRCIYSSSRPEASMCWTHSIQHMFDVAHYPMNHPLIHGLLPQTRFLYDDVVVLAPGQWESTFLPWFLIMYPHTRSPNTKNT